MKDLYTENNKTLTKEIKDTNKWKDHVHGLEDLILFKCPYYPKRSQTQCNPYLNPNGIFYRKRKNNSKLHTEPQKTPNSQNNLEKE